MTSPHDSPPPLCSVLRFGRQECEPGQVAGFLRSANRACWPAAVQQQQQEKHTMQQPQTKYTDTTAAMDRLIYGFINDWPDHQPPVANPPGWSPREDRRIYLAAGAYLSSPPLPPGLSQPVARAIAEAALADARKELALCMAARMAFNQGRPDPAYALELAALPLTELTDRFEASECAESPSDPGVQDWIRGQARQIRYWLTEADRLQGRQRGGQPASLCELRQLAAGLSEMSVDLQEGYLGGEDNPFVRFFDELVDALPEVPWRQFMDEQPAEAILAPTTEETPIAA